MTDILIPPDLMPQEESVEMVDDGTVSFVPQFGAAQTQRAQYFEPYLKVTQTWKSLRLADKARMLAVMDRLKGKYNTLRAFTGFVQRGTMPSTELINNNTFANSVNGWASGQTTLTSFDRTLRLTYDGSSGTNYFADAGIVTLTASAGYAARAMMHFGRGTAPNALGPIIGTNSGGSNYLDVRSAQGYRASAFISSASSARFALGWLGGGNVAGDFAEASYASLARCALVDSGTWSGNALRLKALPASATNLYAIGDLLEVNGELKRVTMPLHSDGSGNGYIEFAPALMRAAITNDAVINYLPFGKFILLDNPKWTNQYGQYADLTLSFRHIYE